MFDWIKRLRSPLTPNLKPAPAAVAAVEQQIIRAMEASGFKVEPGSIAGSGGVVRSFIMRKVAEGEARPGTAPPADPDIDGMSWEVWAGIRGQISRPGWVTCRFPNRTGPDNTGWVFGIAKGDFGVWTQPYEVCHHPMSEEADDKEFAPELVLAAVTHLPSGGGMGLFLDRDMACAAVESILNVDEWASAPAIDYSDTSRNIWAQLLGRAHEVWNFNGLRKSMDCHVHSPAMPAYPITIWERGPIAEMPTKAVLS